MVHSDTIRLPQRNTCVLVDVTTIIGAEEFITAWNRAAPPRDGFARQAFVELIQSLIFMSRVYVAHPVLANPDARDFGDKPRLLRLLMAAGLIYPLRFDADEVRAVRDGEDAALHDLQSWQGSRSFSQFIEQALLCDQAQIGEDGAYPLASRLRSWAEFQAANVRLAGHHADRIGTNDGIENDQFGDWARSAAVFLRGPLQAIAPPGEEKYLVATLVRGLKYRVRADVKFLSYQSHPMRRDFLLTFDLNRKGATEDVVFRVIRAIRGIQESLAATVDEDAKCRVQLLELNLPLLGGRLWRSDEPGHSDGADWLNTVVQRIDEYRRRATDLRAAIERCVTDEDYLRLARDIDGVRRQLLERLGLQRVKLSAVERDLVPGVASVVEAVPGVPSVSAIWIGVRSVGRRLGSAGTPVQRFLYKEFLHAWKRAAR